MVLRNTAALLALRLQDCHLLWCGFPGHFGFSLQIAVCGSYNPAGAETPAVWAGPLSLATTQGVTVVFSSTGYLDVSVPRVSSNRLWIQRKVTGLQPAGFPHSEIRGSKGVCPSPRLIAAYHVLHRLLVPRHPPRALTCLSHSRGSRVCLSILDLSVCLLDDRIPTATEAARADPNPLRFYYGYQYVKERPARRERNAGGVE